MASTFTPTTFTVTLTGEQTEALLAIPWMGDGNEHPDDLVATALLSLDKIREAFLEACSEGDDETYDILSDPSAVRSLLRSQADVEAGRVYPLEDLPSGDI